jgi:hypothetical protein
MTILFWNLQLKLTAQLKPTEGLNGDPAAREREGLGIYPTVSRREMP